MFHSIFGYYYHYHSSLVLFLQNENLKTRKRYFEITIPEKHDTSISEIHIKRLYNSLLTLLNMVLLFILLLIEDFVQLIK